GLPTPADVLPELRQGTDRGALAVVLPDDGLAVDPADAGEGAALTAKGMRTAEAMGGIHFVRQGPRDRAGLGPHLDAPAFPAAGSIQGREPAVRGRDDRGRS